MALTRRGFIAATGAMLVATSLGAAPSDILQIEGPAFGAGWRVRVAAGADAEAIIAAVMTVVEQVKATMSPFRAESEISRFNRTETRDWVVLSPDVCATLAEAKRVSALTHGAFDPTMGGIAGRYGFGPIAGQPEGAFADLALDATGARKGHPRQTFDLCGIAKGYALDLIVSEFSTMGLKDVFVELGGEVMAIGRHPDGQPWRAGIESPIPVTTSLLRRMVVTGEALATSGNRINSYVYHGHRYSHIIDPSRRLPVVGPLASVSVFAPRAMTADALATALFAMGAEKGVAFADRHQLPALFVTRDGAGLREIATGDFSTRDLA